MTRGGGCYLWRAVDRREQAIDARTGERIEVAYLILGGPKHSDVVGPDGRKWRIRPWCAQAAEMRSALLAREAAA